MKDTFSTYNPIVNFVFFIAVISFGMIFLHPVFLMVAFVGSFSYAISLNGLRTLKFSVLFILPMMIVAGVINPLFNHRGITILRYIGDNPLTLESILYGISIAIMFATVILWFSCVNIIMTQDKLNYLFGRLAPALSMVFSMAMRFVPRFKKQAQLIAQSQKCIGRDMSGGNLKDRIKHGIKIISILITWALENAIDTADSMRARGFGLPGRTSFAIYRLDSRDCKVCAYMIVLITVVIIGGILKENNIRYFPYIAINPISEFSYIVYVSYLLLCFTPVTINLKEAAKWRRLQSKI